MWQDEHVANTWMAILIVGVMLLAISVIWAVLRDYRLVGAHQNRRDCADHDKRSQYLAWFKSHIGQPSNFSAQHVSKCRDHVCPVAIGAVIFGVDAMRPAQTPEDDLVRRQFEERDLWIKRAEL